MKKVNCVGFGGSCFLNAVLVADDTTLGSFMDDYPEIEKESVILTVTPFGGASAPQSSDYILQEGDRITIVPKKIPGACE